MRASQTALGVSEGGLPYLAGLKVDEEAGQRVIRAAIYATPDKIGEVSDWSKE